jgi:predicted transposase YdaD
LLISNRLAPLLPRPPIAKPKHPLYFVEVQFQKDDRLYERLLTETFLYLGQYRPQKPWYCVALWSQQTLDPGVPTHYQSLQDARLLKVLSLENLPHQPTRGINLLHLIKADVKQPQDLRPEILRLRQQAQQLPSAGKIQDIIELIDNAILCKFPQLTQEELRAMFDLAEIKQTRVYQMVFKL